MPRKPKRIEPTPRVRRLMEQAALLRAAGWSWAAIARKFGLSPRAAFAWKDRFPALWAGLFAAALSERDDDAEAESIRTLRDMLRVNDAKVQREAARELLRMIRISERRRRAVQIDHPLGSLTHEALEQIIRAFDPDAETAAGASDGAAGAGPR